MYALYVYSKTLVGTTADHYPSWTISVRSFIIYFTVLSTILIFMDGNDLFFLFLPFIHYSLDVSPVGSLKVTVSLLPIIHVHSKQLNGFPKGRKAYPKPFYFSSHDCTVEEWGNLWLKSCYRKGEGQLYWSLGY